MNKRIGLNLFLLMVGVVLFYFITDQPAFFQQDQKGQASHVRLFSMAPYQATDIQIKRQGQLDIVFNKVDDQWLLVKPGIAAVNPDKVKHVLTIINEPVIASYDLAGKDLGAFGLSQGKIKLTINHEELIFGSTNAITLNRYLLKNNKIYTINEIVYGVLGGSVVGFLKHQLLPEPYNIESIVAPELFNHVSDQFWAEVEARNMADYEGDEIVIGKIKLKIKLKTELKMGLREADPANQNQPQIIEFDILASQPVLILGRPDLQVKYTFDKSILNGYR